MNQVAHKCSAASNQAFAILLRLPLILGSRLRFSGAASIVAFVKDHVVGCAEVLNELLAHRFLALDRLELAVRCENDFVLAKAVIGNHRAHQVIECFSGLRRFERKVIFDNLAVDRAQQCVRHRLAAIGNQNLRLLCIKRQIIGHTNVVKVADHVRIQVWLFSNENWNLAINQCVTDHCGNNTALAYACLVANDEALAGNCISDG